MEHIFICYSRKDQKLALQVKEILKKAGKAVWIDLEDLPASSIWRTEIQNAITESIAFIYLVSNNSLESEYCQKEFKFAGELNKRIFPILLPGITNKDVPEIVSSRQWLTWDESNQLDINKLIRDIETDHEWVKFITELGVSEARWKKQPDNSRLLNGKKLLEAEQQLANAGSKKSPQPTDIQREYVKASRKAEQNRRKTITGIATGVSIILCLLCVLTIVGGSIAYVQSNIAAEKELARATAQDTAFSRESAIVAQGLDSQSYESLVLKTLLSIESLRRSSTSSLAIENIHGLSLPQKINSLSSDMSENGTVMVLDGVFSEQDGKALAAGYYSDLYSTLRIWDVETREVVHEWECPYKVASAKFSEDGNFIAIACEGDVISIFDLKKEESTFFSYEKGDIYALDFNSGVPRVFVNNPDGLDWWINGVTGEVIEFQNSQDVSYLKISQDGSMVAGISLDGNKNVYVWDVETGNLKWTITAKDKFDICAFSPNGLFLVIGGDNSISSWSLVDGTLQNSYAFDTAWYINDLQVSPDNTKIGVASSSGLASVIDVATGQQVWSFSGHNSESLSFSPDGFYVAVSDREGTTIVADIANNKTVSVFSYTNAKPGNGIQFSKYSKRVLTLEYVGAALWDFSELGVQYKKAYSGDVFVDPKSEMMVSVLKSQIKLVHLVSSSQPDAVIDIGFDPQTIEVSFKSGIMAFANVDGKILLYSISNGDLLGDIDNKEGIYRMAISPSGHYLVVASASSVVNLYELDSKLAVAQVRVDEANQLSEGTGFVFSPSEESLIVVTGAINSIEIPSGRLLYDIRPIDFVSSNVAYSPDGKYIAFSGKNGFNNSGSTCVYNASSGERTFCAGDYFAGSVQFSKDGNYLYQDSYDNEIIAWDIRTGEVTERFQDLSGPILLGQDSNIIVSSRDSYTKTESVVMLDISSKTEVFRITRNSDYIYVLGFSDDLRRLVIVERNFSQDQSDISTVSGWLWQSADMIEEGCQRVYRNLTTEEWNKYLPGEPWSATCEQLPQPQQ